MKKPFVIIISLIALTSCGNFGKSGKDTGAAAQVSVGTTDNTAKADTTKAVAIKVGQVPADWKAYSNKGYKIQYPRSWDLELDDSTLELALSAPIAAPDSFTTENINLIKKDMAGLGFSLAQMPEVVKELKDHNIVSSERIKYGSMECQKVIFSATQDGLDLEFEQRYFMIHDILYITTLTVRHKEWNKGVNIGEQIMNTFQVNN
jgi:hypothetical protein